MATHSGTLLKSLSDEFLFCEYFTAENSIR